MKAILEFDLNENDDRIDHYKCVMSREMAWALFDVRQLVKKLEFYEDDENIDKHQYINELSKAINQIFEDHDLNLNQLDY